MLTRIFAPVTMITIAAMLTLGLALASVIVVLGTPWLGVVFDRSYEGEGMRVAKVQDNSPAFGKLHAGDIIITFVTPTHGRIVASSLALIEEPDQLSSYVQYNDFFVYQKQVWEVLSSPTFIAILNNQRSVEITPIKSHSLTTLPIAFWWLVFFGGASFLLGVSVWSMRVNDPVTRALAVSGLGFMVGAYSCAIYVSRELAISAEFFFALATTNHLGIMVFAYAAILFFWYYPRRLGNGHAALIYVVGVSALWLNETLQWLSWPAHVFYAHFLVAYGLLFLFSYLQWHKSRGVPLERVMLKWLLTVMLLCLGLTLVMFYGPVILTGKPIASTVVTFGSVFLFYLGLVAGNIRFHQYDMENWWIRAWQWLVFIFIAMIADALFVYFSNLSDSTSLGLTAIMGGVYLLARQWFWGRFSGHTSSALEQALPHLVETLVRQAKVSNPDMQLQQLMTRVYNPISVITIDSECKTVSLERGGIALRLPDMGGMKTIEVFCCNRGNRLFNISDVYLANQLFELMRHSNSLLIAHEQGAITERRRIQRDLHDDVAARLLSLLHQTREPAISKVAHNALRGLRDVINRLDAEEATLMDVVSDIEAGAREQLAESGIHFEWHSPDSYPEIILSSAQRINLRRISREAIANALKHAHPENIIMEIEFNHTVLGLHISNDGVISDPSGWIANRGLNNIKSRVTEMAGSHHWVVEQMPENRRYYRLSVNVPISVS